MHSWNITCCIKHGVKYKVECRKNKLIVTKYVQNVRLWHEHKQTRVFGIGQLHHQSATAPSCTTHAVDSVAARGCLPPGAKVCVASPGNHISFASRVFFRILGRVNQLLGSPPLPSLLIPSPSLSSPLSPSHSPPLSLPPFKIGP